MNPADCLNPLAWLKQFPFHLITGSTTLSTRFQTSIRGWQSAFTARMVALAIISTGGCAAVNELCDEMAVRAMVHQAQHENCVPSELGPTEKVHFKAGWREGYYSVATGGDGCPPLVPPKKYWQLTHPSRSCFVDVWYRGFACGAAAAHEQNAQQGYFVPVMGCEYPVGGNGCLSNSTPCGVGGVCCENAITSESLGPGLDEASEPEEVDAEQIPSAEDFPQESTPKTKLDFPDDVLPEVTDAMLWEEPIDGSASTWFGQPLLMTMECVTQLDEVLSQLENDVDLQQKSTLEFTNIELVTAIEEAYLEAAISQPESLLPYSLLEGQNNSSLSRQAESSLFDGTLADLINPVAEKVTKKPGSRPELTTRKKVPKP